MGKIARDVGDEGGDSSGTWFPRTGRKHGLLRGGLVFFRTKVRTSLFQNTRDTLEGASGGEPMVRLVRRRGLGKRQSLHTYSRRGGTN